MGDPPPGTHLHRLDNHKDYSKENCVWLPDPQGQKFRRNVKLYPWKGEMESAESLAKLAGILPNTIRGRLKAGWSVEKAMQTKPQVNNSTKPRLGTNSTHGMSGTPTYEAWQSAKTRCYNPNYHNYCEYGGVGLRCARNGCMALLISLKMGVCPKGMSLHRKDPNKGYCKEKCRWALKERSSHRTKAYTNDRVQRSNQMQGRLGA